MLDPRFQPPRRCRQPIFLHSQARYKTTAFKVLPKCFSLRLCIGRRRSALQTPSQTTRKNQLCHLIQSSRRRCAALSCWLLLASAVFAFWSQSSLQPVSKPCLHLFRSRIWKVFWISWQKPTRPSCSTEQVVPATFQQVVARDP